MPPTKKAASKRGRSTSATERSRARIEETERVIRRVARSLDAAQADLANVKGSVGTAVAGLRRDLAKRLRDAQREATKMSKATRKDLERLQKDMRAAAKGGSARTSSRASRTAKAARNSRRTTTSRGSRSTAAAGKSRAGASARKSRASGSSATTRSAATKKRSTSKAR